MRTTLHITIPEPCHEDWNAMTPQEKGRHCAACQKTVIDFTKTTDEQIVKTFQAESKLCGRFKSTQLNRALVLSRKERNNYLSYVASTLFAFLSIGNQTVEAQGKPKVVKTDSSYVNTLEGFVGMPILKAKTVSGIVNFSEESLPIVGVNVVIKGTSRGTVTNSEGYYNIKAKKGDILVFSYLGFETIELIVSNQHKYNLYLLESDLDITGEVVIENNLKKDSKKRRRQHIKNGNIERSIIGKFLYSISSIFRTKE